MSFNNPITSGLTETNILGNIPSIPLISNRNYFLQQLESWMSTPASTTQWIVLFEDFPKLLKQEVLQELEYTTGDKISWNIPYERLTNIAYQKVIGCVFCQGMELPQDRISINNAETISRSFIGTPTSGTRQGFAPLKLDFLETNLSFVDLILRPWVILTAHKGLVARPKDESIKTNITIIEYAKTNQYLSQVPRKVWNFYDVAPISISQTSHGYSEENTEIRKGIEFLYSRYTVHGSTYIPVFSLIDKFMSGGISELQNIVTVGSSINNLGKLF